MLPAAGTVQCTASKESVPLLKTPSWDASLCPLDRAAAPDGVPLASLGRPMPLTSASTSPELRNTALFGAAALHAIARAELAGRSQRRLTETGRATWRRFQGRLGPRHLARLLIEDAAVI